MDQTDGALNGSITFRDGPRNNSSISPSYLRTYAPSMTYELFIGDRTFSSWSLRGWLMLEKFGIPYKTHMVGLYTGTLQADLAELAPARRVPVLRDENGVVIHDTLAIAETLAERHPKQQLWPEDPSARALARSITAEIHSEFSALRQDCPMQLMHQVQNFNASDAVTQDLARLDALWTIARRDYGQAGPWLFGRYSLADVFYAPVAARIAGYDLKVDEVAQAYVTQTLTDTVFRQWRAVGLTKNYDPVPYDFGLPKSAWPGPTSPKARAVAEGIAENTVCPYSGKAPSHLLEVNGRTFGFCDTVCRDKTVNDPDAWPEFVALRERLKK